jgi:hypothetical protein
LYPRADNSNDLAIVAKHLANHHFYGLNYIRVFVSVLVLF